AGQCQTGGSDGLGRAHGLAGEGRRAAAEADGVAADHAAEGAVHDGGGSGAVVSLAAGSNAAVDGGFDNVKRSANSTGQAAGNTSGELFANAGRADRQAGESRR